MAAEHRQIRNIGIFAHVDAGKTTTTEQILFHSGRTRALGSVDNGTAQTDWLDVERERGISVRAAVTRFDWQGMTVNIIDTPGHVDFVAEVERSLRVMDGALLVVSAVEGVQAQTEVIWQALRDRGLPTIIFINKLDRVGADPQRVLDEVKRLLTDRAAPIQAPMGAEDAYTGNLALLELLQDALLPEAEAFETQLIETAAEQDEQLLERYLNDQPIAREELAALVWSLTRQARLVPVLFGAANRGIGVEALMDAMVIGVPEPQGDMQAPVSGVVFKLERDPAMGKLAYVRLYSGTVHNRESVRNATQDIEEKVTQIRKIDGQRAEDVGVLAAGDIAAVCGWNRVRIGDVIGDPAHVPEAPRMAVPLLTVQVRWRSEADYPAVVAALQELADEDPLLDLQWLQGQRELHLKVMGPIQVEVLSHIMRSRFGLEVAFDPPSVIYKETPAGVGEGYVAYLTPKPCWAILRFRIEPLERGSGLQYSSIVRTDRLLESYQNEVERRVPEALQQGLRGWEVTDLRVTLIEGEHHVWHTHPLDFVVATPMGIMDGLNRIGTKLLEPMLRFRISVPEEVGGRVMNELLGMRGRFDTPVVRQERMELEGELPVATSLDFPARFGSMTKGRGVLSTFFAGYQECPPDVEAERPRVGVNPLDQAKYILAVRSAITSS
ncbi:GTP-binding protein [Xylanibacillus composti]|uniref:Tetracycline resistance protein n=1 Tax=Xylanibacillus composti TaxID=1572762 RepID=A0A8J4M223_9BACL|nr:TetM/TetW/TetO/TetS family tetracycline resistance ribosomal protection protein [Xylanibacillus composti]MDT9725801.1 GTP-binding protein [Xylanibacillus composti]GIQ69244.1 tetracycline resistance protein [Xylanibacillus composti]